MSTDPENEAPRRSGRGAENESKPCKTHNAMKKFYTKNPQKQEDDSYESNQNIHIPEDFPLDCLGAAKQYLELGLVPIPLNRFDEGTEKERGKKPKIRGYRQLTNSGINTSYPGNHWGGTRPANVGLTLCGDHIVIDVDSKADGGASARKFVEEHPILSSFPREITPGGVHIHLLCPDLPRHDDTGKKRKSPLVCQWNEDLTFELMSDGMPITVAPSMHKTGTRYRWEKTGKLLVLLWAEVQRIFGFEDPSETDGTHCKGRPWWREWEEDLRTLRLTDLLRDLGLLGQCLASRDGKWAVRCPWESEHSGDPAHEPGSDTVIFHKPDELPAFKCLHSHCAKRRIEDFLKALERKHPGKITKYCDQVADASRASKPSTRRPRILLPVGGRSASEFAKEVGETIGPTNELFVRGNDIVELVPSDSGMAIASEFDVLSPKSLVTAVERSAEIGRVKSDDEGAPTFVTQSMSEAQARVLSSSRQFRQELPRIERILPIRIPHLESGSLCYPELGYNSISLTWVSTDAPSIGGMSLAEAKETLLNEVLAGPDQGGFFWRDAQAQTHALARVLTSYCRGLMNWARTPVFIFAGNREGCGKDTCAAIASTLITGSAAIGAPLSKHSDDEMRKRITATHRAGRQSLHFANLKGDIDFASLEAATDGSGFWEDRVLGSSMIVRLRNEAEYSLSANHATWSPDLERRCRQVQLHLAEENVNAVSYRFPNLLRHVQINRTRYLAALDAFVRQWVDEGCPEGPTRFTSFPEWGRVVGGILYACGLGDPCLPHPETETCGDQETIAMRSLFRWAFERYGDKAMDKQTVVAAVRGNTGNLVESAGIRAVWELENELLPVVVQFEEAGMPVHAPSMLRIRGKHKDEALRLLEHVEADGRIRAKFNPLGTRTGRFSCEKPNLQGVSRGIVREALRPAAGNLFLNADYSQIELRVAAEIASSVTLIKAFQSGVDIHEATASRVLGKTFESLSKEERQLGKGLNFGLLYGQSASGFRSTVKKRFGLEISAQEASVYRNVFFQTYPELRAWHNLVRKDAQAGLSEARTLIGRRRLLPKELPFRKRFSTLLNTPVQGTMADGMKRALCLLDRELPQGAKIVSVIHDEVILEVPSSLATEELLNLVRQCLVDGMRSVLPTVPIEVDPHFSESWN